MYNGIGLQTARGSGTNGYVQTNKFFIKPRTTGGPHRPPLPDAAGGDGGSGLGGMRKPNKEILEHDRKRQVELKLLVLRDALEEQGYTEGEIEERVEEARRAAEAEAVAAAAAEEAGGGRRPSLPGRGFTDTQSHHVAARKEKQLEAMRAALGLNADDVKKGNVESDVESGELVPGKYSEELDTAGQKDSKDTKDSRKDAKKNKKKKGSDKSSRSKSSRKSKYDSDSEQEHDTKTKKNSRRDSEDDSGSDYDAKEKKHSKKTRLGSDDDSETDRKKARRGKNSRHDSESDTDSDYGKKKSEHAKNNHDERKKVAVKSSRHYSESDTDNKYGKKKTERSKNSRGERKKIQVKSLRHDSESDTDSDYGKKKTEHAKSNHDERKKIPVKSSRHDSDSDTDSDYGKKRTELDKNNGNEKKKIPVKSSRQSFENEKPGESRYKDSSRHYSEDGKPMKYKESSRHGSEDEKPRKYDESSRRDLEDEKPRLNKYKGGSHGDYDQKRQKSVKKSNYSSESESDSDSDQGERLKHGKISQHKSEHDRLKSDPRNDDHSINKSVKKTHGSDGEKPRSKVLRKDKYSDDSGTDSDTRVKEKKKLEKSYHHAPKEDKQAQKIKEKEDNYGKNIDKRKRHDTDSESDDYTRDRKRQLSAAVTKKDVPEKRRVASSSESSDYSSSFSSSESDTSADRDSYDEPKRGQGERRGDELNRQRQKEERQELEKSKQREEERKELEKQKQREEERMEMEKKRQREREEERPREKEQDRRKGGNDVERDYKRKIEDDRYDPNSSRVRDEGYRGHQNRGDERRHEEHGRHRARDLDIHGSKRSRHDDDSYYHSRGDRGDRYSRDEHRDRRRH